MKYFGRVDYIFMSELEKRFLQFSKSVVVFCRGLQLDTISRPLVSQLIRSATSIGANYSESQSGASMKDFRAKVSIAKKEAQETKYWLAILTSCFPNKQIELTSLAHESNQICKILQTILNKTKP